MALADFAAFEQVQSKAAFSALLERLAVPQPATTIIRSADDLMAERVYPFFLKAAFGTVSAGVWRIDNRKQLEARLPGLEARGAFEDRSIAQVAISGALERAQPVFDRGPLGGEPHLSASRRRTRRWRHYEVQCEPTRGPSPGQADRHCAGLARRLSFEYIIETETGTARFIGANPRLVKPVNALLSGTDLVGALLRVTLSVAQPRQPVGRSGVLTRLGLMGLLDAARRRSLACAATC